MRRKTVRNHSGYCRTPEDRIRTEPHNPSPAMPTARPSDNSSSDPPGRASAHPARSPRFRFRRNSSSKDEASDLLSFSPHHRYRSSVRTEIHVLRYSPYARRSNSHVPVKRTAPPAHRLQKSSKILLKVFLSWLPSSYSPTLYHILPYLTSTDYNDTGGKFYLLSPFG